MKLKAELETRINEVVLYFKEVKKDTTDKEVKLFEQKLRQELNKFDLSEKELLNKLDNIELSLYVRYFGGYSNPRREIGFRI